MAKYYRPPQGIYSTDNLEMAKQLGYKTFFWSLAYVDWQQDQQPTHDEAFEKLLSRVHPGAVVLLHNTSKTNGEIMDELLSKWEAMGYTFSSSVRTHPGGVLKKRQRTALSFRYCPLSLCFIFSFWL